MEQEQIIINTLFDIKETIGKLSTKIDGMTDTLQKHIIDDKVVEARVINVENQQSRLKWMASGAGAVVIVAWKVVETFITSRH